MSGRQDDGEITHVSVVFLDVRNSTLFIDNYDETTVTDLLDTLFTKARDSIVGADGEVDKVIGDGLMAVFRGERPGRRAVRAALDIYKDGVTETEREQQFSPIEVGVGIASGPVHETTLAEIDETVIGRTVNVAARLQGLCKEYDLSILIDESTHEELSPGDLPDSFAERYIPKQSLRGIRQSVNTYNICDTNRLDRTYVETFNRGVEQFLNQNYDGALGEFTKAYTRHERYADGTLLNHFTNECLEQLHGSQELFRNPEGYENHSTTQQQQGIRLQSYVRQEMMRRDGEPETILDVGCGTGKVTEQLYAEMFPESTVVGIDPSTQAIAKAKTDHSPEGANVEYREAHVERYCPDEERGRYDLIFSNSAMHWVDEQDRAYENLRSLVADDGLLAVHQGGKGSYKELHRVAIDLVDRFDYRHYFEDLRPPLDLTYYSEDEMKAILRRHGFEIRQCDVNNESAPETIVEDFAEASLNAYCQRLESSSQREVLKEQFKKEAHAAYDPEDVTVRRIYVTAEPGSA